MAAEHLSIGTAKSFEVAGKVRTSGPVEKARRSELGDIAAVAAD